MPIFKYQAMNSKGKQVSGTIEAESSIEAINKLRENSFFPTSVSETTAAKGESVTAKKKFLSTDITLFESKSVSMMKLTVFVRQFATLISAGLPLLRSIRVLSDQQSKGYLKKVLDQIALSVEAGSSFSEALKEYPEVFSKLFVSMVKAGEISGAFDVVLNRLADYFEKTMKLRKKVISAMVYPACIMTVALAILAFLMAFIIPKFGEMFADMELELPAVTELLITMSHGVKEYWYAPVFAIIVLSFIFKMMIKNDKFRYAFDKIKINIPMFGSLFLKVYISRFTRTLSTLISSGVPLLQALMNIKDTIGNEVVAAAITNIHNNVREGESIVEPMKDSPVFSPLVVNMIDVGEETGSMDSMLARIADSYDDDVDNAVSSLTSLLEPLMIVILAVIVGFIVIALFLPMISLVTQLSG